MRFTASDCEGMLEAAPPREFTALPQTVDRHHALVSRKSQEIQKFNGSNASCIRQLPFVCEVLICSNARTFAK